MFCSRCGAANPDDGAFCGKCGAPLRGGVAAEASGMGAHVAAAPKAGPNKTAIIVVAAIVAIAVVVGVIFGVTQCSGTGAGDAGEDGSEPAATLPNYNVVFSRYDNAGSSYRSSMSFETFDSGKMTVAIDRNAVTGTMEIEEATADSIIINLTDLKYDEDDWNGYELESVKVQVPRNASSGNAVGEWKLSIGYYTHGEIRYAGYYGQILSDGTCRGDYGEDVFSPSWTPTDDEYYSGTYEVPSGGYYEFYDTKGTHRYSGTIVRN